METSFNRICTKDGLELAGLLYESEKPNGKILVHVHGMGGNFYENKFLDFIAQELTANGIALFTFNNRGCELAKDLYKIEGNKRNIVRIGNSYEKFEDSALDIKAAIDFALSKGFSEIHLSGHSLGGPKIAYYSAELNDNRIKSLIFISPADMVGLAKKDKDYQRDIDTAKKMIADGKGEELMPFLVWDENYLSADTYMSISSETSKVAIFNFYDPKDLLPVLSKIKIPALTIMGSKDGALVIPIKETMNRIKKAMVSSPNVETNILGDADHQYNDYGQQLADSIRSWIQKM
jgi:alpha-beta hydrolase superfamily lysophospholipase